MSEKIPVTRGSGNVFADLGLDHPEERLRKSRLAQKIAEIIAAKELTQTEAAKRLGITQPKVSAIVRGNLDGFSIDRLLEFLSALGRTVTIVVQDPPKETNAHGELLVSFQAAHDAVMRRHRGAVKKLAKR